MTPALPRLIFLILFVSACAPVREPPPLHVGDRGCAEGVEERSENLWRPCTRAEAENRTAGGNLGFPEALEAARCLVVLIEGGSDPAQMSEDAEKGILAARTAVAQCPGSGLAHYLLAYLTGLKASHDPLRGLRYVTIIEEEARQAARLNPAVDHGGPYRMLGELYLRAPSFPVSIGDSEKAVAFLRLAVAQAPGYPENRLGLARALVAEGRKGEACSELKILLAGPETFDGKVSVRGEALHLFRRLCEEEGKE